MTPTSKFKVGQVCWATSEAPFTSVQRQRLGTILALLGSRVHVEWAEKVPGTCVVWRTRSWVPATWVEAAE